MVTELIQPDSWGIDNTEDFIQLAGHARKFSQNKVNILSQKVESEALQKGPDYWYGKIT